MNINFKGFLRMSDVVTEIEESFKQLLKTQRLRSVTVKDICAGAHVSRNTFYANFIDKRAVLAKLFRADAIEPVQRINALLSADEAIVVSPAIIARFYTGVLENGDFYADIIPATGPEDATFMLIVARAVYGLIIQSMKGVTFHGTEQELQLAAYAQASSQAVMLTEWIGKRYDTPVETLAELQAEMIVPFWAERAHMDLPDKLTLL